MQGISEQRSSFWDEAFQYWKDRYPQILTTGGNALVTTGLLWLTLGVQLQYSGYWWMHVPVAVVVFGLVDGFIGNWKSWTFQKRQSELEEKISEAQKRANDAEEESQLSQKRAWEMMDDFLGIVALGLFEFGSEERITLYVHKKVFFEIAGRFSSNPDYRARSDKQYNQSQGVIGQAWRHGQAKSDILPDPERDPEGYLEKQKEWKIPKGVANQLRMRSRFYHGFAVFDQAGMKPLAVLLCETVKGQDLNLERHEKMIKEILCRQLAVILEKKVIPPRKQATERGF